MSDKKKKKKVVRATDASALNRLRKKLGVEFLEDMTDKELQAVLDTPDSVFGTMKRQGNVGAERARRKALTDEAYKDEILRNRNGAVMKKRGGTSKTLDIDTMIELGLFDKETDSKTLPKSKPKTPKTLPKPKPKTPTETAAKKKKKSSGVTFDTSGTLKKSAMGRAVMKKRGGTFKGVF